MIRRHRRLRLIVFANINIIYCVMGQEFYNIAHGVDCDEWRHSNAWTPIWLVLPVHDGPCKHKAL
jgi:hypothetical protein